MSFFKKLFGLGSGDAGGAKVAAQQNHEGYTLISAPVSEGGQYRLSGKITKEFDGEIKEHVLIRADMFPGVEDCNAAFMRKAKQVIKEQGDNLFKKS